MDVRVSVGKPHLQLRDPGKLLVAGPGGKQVPLDQQATIKKTTGPEEVYRVDQHRAVTVRVWVPSDRPRIVPRDLRRRLEAMDVPAGYTLQFGSESGH